MTPRLEVIAGPMFSGKTEELIRRYKRAEIAKQAVVAVKPIIDTRSSSTEIRSHGGACIPAVPLHVSGDLLLYPEWMNYTQIFIDEVQFFESKLIEEIDLYLKVGGKVVVAGLDMTYRGEPFGIMPTLMALADSVDKYSSICNICGEDAVFSHRRAEGEETIQVGGLESYEARCRKHFV